MRQKPVCSLAGRPPTCCVFGLDQEAHPVYSHEQRQAGGRKDSMRPRKRSVPLAPAPLDPALAYLGTPEDRDALVAACAELQLDVVAVAGGDADDGGANALALALDAAAAAGSMALRRRQPRR